MLSWETARREVAQLTLDIRNDCILIDTDTQNLTLPIDPDDTTELLVLCRREDRLSRDAIHVNASTSLEFVKVDEAEFRDEINDTMLLRHLHRNGKIVCGFRREKDVNCFLLEGRIGSLMTDLNDMKLLCQDHLQQPALTFAPTAVLTAKENSLLG